MNMELPELGGAYVLIIRVARVVHIRLGRLGDYELVPGFYAYVGSACGRGGIRDCVDQHLASASDPIEHIDILLSHAELVEVWYAVSDRRLVGEWASSLAAAPGFQQPIPRFGSSDYHRSRTNHLFFCRKYPQFQWFKTIIRDRFEDAVAPMCQPMAASPSGLNERIRR